MKTDFFAIVALVVTLSGVAFAFLIALRQLSGERVADWLERAGSYRSNVLKSRSNSLKTLAFVGHWMLKCSYGVWFVSLLAPILFLAIYAWVSSGKVLESYYSSDPQPIPAAADTAGATTPKADSADKMKSSIAAHGALGLMGEEWYADCIDCQMWWLWWIKWLSIASVVVAIATVATMRSGLWLVTCANNTMEENQGLQPQKKPRANSKA